MVPPFGRSSIIVCPKPIVKGNGREKSTKTQGKEEIFFMKSCLLGVLGVGYLKKILPLSGKRENGAARPMGTGRRGARATAFKKDL